MKVAVCLFVSALLRVASTCILISGDESRNILFCACEHSGARGRFQLALDLELDKASVSLTERTSQFERWIRADRPAIEKATVGFLSCENCLWMQGMARV